VDERDTDSVNRRGPSGPLRTFSPRYARLVARSALHLARFKTGRRAFGARAFCAFRARCSVLRWFAARLSRAAGEAACVGFSVMHLRPPSVDQGVQSFIWAVVFFLFLWFGMLAVGVSGGTAFLLALLAGLGIFLFVRMFGEEEVRPRRVARRR
jgi:hypothetical protein